MRLENRIRIMKTSGELTIDLSDKLIDVFFLYDIIHIIIMIEGNLKPFQLLLSEIIRVLKPNGLLSISIEHLDEINYTKSEIITESKRNFSLRDTITDTLMHWDWLKLGSVDNFILNSERERGEKKESEVNF